MKFNSSSQAIVAAKKEKVYEIAFTRAGSLPGFLIQVADETTGRIVAATKDNQSVCTIQCTQTTPDSTTLDMTFSSDMPMGLFTVGIAMPFTGAMGLLAKKKSRKSIELIASQIKAAAES